MPPASSPSTDGSPSWPSSRAKGGEGERDKFRDCYAQTLESYRRIFGTEPPPDIWPDARVRFGEDIHHQRVNTSRYWLVRKPWMRGARS